MDLWSRVAERMPKDSPMKVLPKISWAQQAPTYQQAEPALIDAALQRAHRRPTGKLMSVRKVSAVRLSRRS